MMARLKILPDKPRGTAWPSSARGVNCPVKSGNERDPHVLLPAFLCRKAHSVQTARVKWEEGEGDDRSVWSESSWATRGLQWLGQWAATPKGEANLTNPAQVRIEGWNSPS